MSKITLDNLSNNLKDYLNKLGITEERVIEIINDNLPQDLVERVENIEVNVDEVTNTIENLNKTIGNLQNKLIDVMIYLNMSNNGNVDSVGYWYDDLSNTENITFIEGLIIDVDRKRIFGAPGNVIFKQLDAPFTSNKLNISIDFDNNFIESISNFNGNVGDTQITIDEFVYKVE